MQGYTTTYTVGQWASQTLRTYGVSQTATQVLPQVLLFRFVWEEMPPFVAPNEPNVINEQDLARLYAEFAEEDRALANAGLADYARMLAAEDAG